MRAFSDTGNRAMAVSNPPDYKLFTVRGCTRFSNIKVPDTDCSHRFDLSDPEASDKHRIVAALSSRRDLAILLVEPISSRLPAVSSNG